MRVRERRVHPIGDRHAPLLGHPIDCEVEPIAPLTGCQDAYRLGAASTRMALTITSCFFPLRARLPS